MVVKAAVMVADPTDRLEQRRDREEAQARREKKEAGEAPRSNMIPVYSAWRNLRSWHWSP